MIKVITVASTTVSRATKHYWGGERRCISVVVCRWSAVFSKHAKTQWSEREETSSSRVYC